MNLLHNAYQVIYNITAYDTVILYILQSLKQFASTIKHQIDIIRTMLLTLNKSLVPREMKTLMSSKLIHPCIFLTTDRAMKIAIIRVLFHVEQDMKFFITPGS